ncbi:CLOCK-interacting pacemaker isoform X2 [Sceloporus undulatus]|uniref:CLOCK-interacting pacemaker isoform X2 n=1 Tax=Sceloporus undulatus TaxID=8520 RepID=UPI001C4D4D80|nr:CLOCK-interacting pacemaker isoform X2 [Sceloporus undulatus]
MRVSGCKDNLELGGFIAAMPLDQGHPPSGHPTKPAKERSNQSAAGSLKAGGLASEDPGDQAEKMERPGGEASREPSHSASEGEKDSGFSDVSSEYLSTVEQTDTEDPPGNTQRHQQAKPLRAPPKAPPGGLAGGPFPGLAPVYIVKNVILKQPLGTSPTTQFLAWSSQNPLDASQGPPARVLFIQPPVASLKTLLPGPKSLAKEAYLPILSTYPKIAPHPGHDLQTKEPAEGGTAPEEGTIKNKRFCLEEAWVSSSDPVVPKDCGEKQCEEPSLADWNQNLVTSSTELEQAEGRMIAKASKKLGGSSLGKQRRFHNTVEILRKSGLLGITLKTKELIRQNSATQRELVELREHAQLLCEAVQSNDTQAWARLQEAMERSGAYWAGKGSKTSVRQPGGRQELGRGAEPPNCISDPTRESPPNLPVNLSPTLDTLEQVTLP